MVEQSKLRSVRFSKAYALYGYCEAWGGESPLLAFGGEHLDVVSMGYLLGNGYRVYSPVLMRFISPDLESPFAEGGANTYAYCGGDPVNYKDPDGRASIAVAAKVVIGVVRFKKMLSTRVHGSIGWKPIPNVHRGKLFTEVREARVKLASGTTLLTHVKDKSDLSVLSRDWTKHKFVVGRDNEFFVGSYSEFDDVPVSHPAIAELGRRQLKSRHGVVSAGYIYSENGQTYVNNHSGHYLPSYESLQPALSFLKSIGLNVKSVRRSGYTSVR